MIETEDGVRNVDAIAATPGVDAIYIGPGDLALSLGLSAWPEDWTPAEAKLHADTVERIRLRLRRERHRTRHAYGRRRVAHRYLQQGFQMVTVANELGLITLGARRTSRWPGARPPPAAAGSDGLERARRRHER